MDIPINVDVFCLDGLAGRSTAMVINPDNETLTHLVVKKHNHGHDQYMVPTQFIQSSTPEEIRLNISLEKFQAMDPFLETQFVQLDMPHVIPANSYSAMPYFLNEDKTVLIENEQVPDGEMAIHRQAKVKATDGFVGKVDEFLVDPGTSKITHLVLREGHLWDSKEVSIPISEIRRIGSGTVYLKLNKQQVGDLPVLVHSKVEV